MKTGPQERKLVSVWWKWKQLLLPKAHPISSLRSGCMGLGLVLIKQLSGLEVVRELFKKPLWRPSMAHLHLLCGQKLTQKVRKDALPLLQYNET